MEDNNLNNENEDFSLKNENTPNEKIDANSSSLLHQVQSNNQTNKSDEKINQTNNYINTSSLDKYISQINSFDDSYDSKFDYNNGTNETDNFDENSSDISYDTNEENPLSTIAPDEIKEKKNKKFFIGGALYSFFFVFCLTLITITYTFNFLLIPIKVVGISMQPTINSSTYYLGNEDEEHCDIVYYKKTKN
ncbi:MAG: hypothetical protein IJX17_02565 [Clostridia bacterium]|nr:hypothetical protein [Clostridia bacterium]